MREKAVNLGTEVDHAHKNGMDATQVGKEDQ